MQTILVITHCGGQCQITVRTTAKAGEFELEHSFWDVNDGVGKFVHEKTEIEDRRGLMATIEALVD